MTFRVKFSEQSGSFRARFGAVQTASDGGFDRGYAEGYEKGNADGYRKGYDEGLAARTYETWTITLVDGTIVEKDVALL